ncbi:MAG TPA: response regulator, partial [Bryobacterales bacterium]|nr:response regulator [Bryobacterales bacterium]
EATNGKEAMEQIRRTAFDLAIMDIIMPEQDGIETIRTLKTEQPGLKVIVISGAFSGSDLAIYLRTGELLGATASLQKPVSAPAVLETVRRVLGVQ